jgi:hypothetical protein
MFFDPMYTMGQLLRAVAQPRRVTSVARTSETPAVGIGCCPVCHEFVRARLPGPSARTFCPSCGRTIRSLDPLGSNGSLGATDEL